MSVGAPGSVPTSDASPPRRARRLNQGRGSVMIAEPAVASKPAVRGAAPRSLSRSSEAPKAQAKAAREGRVARTAAAKGERDWAPNDNGVRRSLRQGLQKSSDKLNTAPPPRSHELLARPAGGAAAKPNGGAAAAAPPSAGCCITVNAPAAGAPRKRVRQLQRQLLQNYVVGQQHQQVGLQEEGQEPDPCLAEWLDVESRVPCCCCGRTCASGRATCGCMGEPANDHSTSSSSRRRHNCNSSSSSSSSSSRNNKGSSGQTSAGAAVRASGAGLRSTFEAQPTAAKRQRQQRQQQHRQEEQEEQQQHEQQRQQQQGKQQQQQQQQQEVGGGLSFVIDEHNVAEGLAVSPSWFVDPAEAEEYQANSIMRPSSPTRASVFFSGQSHWESIDTRDSAERAAATGGTPWPKGSPSSSFGGYGAATRAGGALPLCCHCGLPLRPPAGGAARGAGAETGCPLTAAASAAHALGLDGSTTQWCRCCTRVYGELRLQQHRDATFLPFNGFSVPKAPLRFVLLPADFGRDLPGGAGAVAAAAAAVAADPRRGRHAPEDSAAAPAPTAAPTPAITTTAATTASTTATPAGGTAPAAGPAASAASFAAKPAAPAAAHADGERDASLGTNSSSSPSLLSLRRTRSGCHFPRTPLARTGSRSSTLVDISRFRGASCCWSSNCSKDAYMQPVARLQQQLMQLLQAPVDLSPLPQQHAQQASQHCKIVLSGLQARAVPSDAGAARPAPHTPLPPGTPAPAAPAAAPATEAAAAGHSQGTKGETGGEIFSPSASLATRGDAGKVLCAGAKDAGDSMDVCKKPETTSNMKEVEPALTQTSCASSEVASEGLEQSPSSLTSNPPAAQQPMLTDTENLDTGQAGGGTVVLPRVYMEIKSSCYVATAFDPSHKQLLQKRFCCSILGEQRAHLLACQWLRWVDQGCSPREQ
ncbi:hypothetical protein ACSSS7_004264 [Eimeria intestinalis]